MSSTALKFTEFESDPAAEPTIGYILKGYPRTSETFITNEIYLLERMGLQLRIFSVKKLEGQQRHAVEACIKAPLAYLPEATPLGEQSFPLWLKTNLPLFVESNWKMFKRRPIAYLRTFAEMLGMSVRYRIGLWAMPRTVFFKEFLQAGYIASEVSTSARIRHLHAHFCHGTTTIAMFVSSMTGVPFSFTAHAKDIYRQDLNPGDLLPRKMRRARFVVTCTAANAQFLRGRRSGGAKVHTIYHGLDTAKFSPSRGQLNQDASRVPCILSAGRFVEKKGFDYLVKACRLLKDRGCRFRCRIVGGKDQYSEVIEDLIHKLSLEDTVTLHHAVTQEELKDIYAQSTVFCLPCRIAGNGDRDGIPNVLAEAMAMEIPVVSTNVSGIPEIIRHGANGLLVPEKDTEALADAIEQFLNAPAFARRLGIAARRTICEVFDSKQNTVALRDLFLGCLETNERMHTR